MTTRLLRRLSPLAGCLFSVCGWAADDFNQPAVRVFTSPWARLFSGSESSFSAALTYNSDLARHPVYVPTRRLFRDRDKYNQRLLLSMVFADELFLRQHDGANAAAGHQ